MRRKETGEEPELTSFVQTERPNFDPRRPSQKFSMRLVHALAAALLLVPDANAWQWRGGMERDVVPDGTRESSSSGRSPPFPFFASSHSGFDPSLQILPRFTFKTVELTLLPFSTPFIALDLPDPSKPDHLLALEDPSASSSAFSSLSLSPQEHRALFSSLHESLIYTS